MAFLRAGFSLAITDVQKTARFYSQVFGTASVSQEDGMVVLGLPGVTVFFIEREAFSDAIKPTGEEARFTTGTYTSMLTVSVETLDEAYGSLKKAVEGGGTPCGQAVAYPWGRAAYFKDPDDHLWEIVWRNPNNPTA